MLSTCTSCPIMQVLAQPGASRSATRTAKPLMRKAEGRSTGSYTLLVGVTRDQQPSAAQVPPMLAVGITPLLQPSDRRAPNRRARRMGRASADGDSLPYPRNAKESPGLAA